MATADCCLYWGGLQVDVKVATGNLLSSMYIVCRSRRQLRLNSLPWNCWWNKAPPKTVFFQKDHWNDWSTWTPIGIGFALLSFLYPTPAIHRPILRHQPTRSWPAVLTQAVVINGVIDAGLKVSFHKNLSAKLRNVQVVEALYGMILPSM